MNDVMQYNRVHIDKLSTSIAGQKALQNNKADKITPNKEKVLIALSKIFPGRDISNLLMNVETIQDERERDILFRLITSSLKENNNILPQILEKVAKLIDILASRVRENQTISHVTPIFYYGK